MRDGANRVQNLLNKVYYRLEEVEVSKLSYSELEQFLKVTQMCLSQEYYMKTQEVEPTAYTYDEF